MLSAAIVISSFIDMMVSSHYYFSVFHKNHFSCIDRVKKTSILFHRRKNILSRAITGQCRPGPDCADSV